MSIFQILATIFAFFMLYVVSIHVRKQTISKVEASFWYSVWFFFIVIALFPDLLLGVTGVLRFSRVFDLLIVLAFVVLSLLSFFSYFMLRQVNQKIETLVRRQALNDHAKSKTKNK